MSKSSCISESGHHEMGSILIDKIDILPIFKEGSGAVFSSAGGRVPLPRSPQTAGAKQSCLRKNRQSSQCRKLTLRFVQYFRL